MFRSAVRAVAAASLWLFLFSPSIYAQSTPPRHPPRPKSLGPAKWNPSPQEVSTAYWTLETGWNTELEMRNNLLSRELTVTPVLRTADGQEASLAPVTIAPQHVVSLDLRSLAQNDPKILDDVGLFGSAVFRFDGLDAANLFAAAIVQRQGRPIDFHFDASNASSYNSGGIEGIWWLPAESATDYLILTNPSKKTVNANLALSTQSGNNPRVPVSIGPGQTKRIDVREVLGSAAAGGSGGLSLSLPGKESLAATQIVVDEILGLAAMMKLFERVPDDQPNNHILRAPMMALSQPDRGLGFPTGTMLIPRIFLRNAALIPTQVSLAVDWRSEGKSGEFAPPALILSPGEVRVINLMDRQTSGQIPAEATWATVKLSYTGKTADLVPIALSYDNNLRHGLQTPFSEGTSHQWAGGMWHVDSTHNTFITTGNGGSESTTAEATLFYNGGKDKFRVEKKLAPGQQLWLDVGQAIHNQVPDSDGHTLPPETMTGSYELRDLDHATVGQLYEGKLVIDKTYGHAAYGCSECCGYLGVKLTPNPFSGPPGYDYGDEITATASCGGYLVDVTDGGYNWASSNTAVATLTSATLHTVAVGSATGSSAIQLESSHPEPSGNCQTRNYNLQQPVTVSGIPTSETTQFYGMVPNLITEATFQMTLNPGTNNYDGHFVEESSPSPGANSCWWQGSGMVQNPTVVGSTWTVGQSPAPHDGYGLDGIGFASGVVNLIQTQGGANGVSFPCVVTIYQEMTYEGDANTFFAYAENVLTQTIGSNTVKVCRAGVCSPTIPF